MNTQQKAAVELTRISAHIARVAMALGNGHRANGNRAASPVLKLQGRYMGLVRLMKPRTKSKYRKIRAQKGLREAIRAIMRDRG